jgi:hypothetical protein
MFGDKVAPYQSEGLAYKHQTGPKNLDRDKHSSLLQKFVNYGQKSFITLASGVNFINKFGP